MNNPFKISSEKLKELLSGYSAWLKSDPVEEKYPATIREQSKKIKDEFLNQEVLSRMSDDDLYEKIFKYSRKLEGPVHMRLGEPRLRGDLKEIKRNLIYVITSEDSPFMVAQNILDGEYKIEVFAKAFWTPIFQAQFPGVLPNWNNKTEKFFKKFNINLSTSKLSISEKYRIISEAFTFLSELIEGHDFYTINHLMHYGTVIPEGIQLINEITGTKTSDPVSEMVRKYKVQIRNKGLKDELYKWELLKKYNGRPDIESNDFSSEIKGIDFQNLIYPMARAVKDHIANDLAEEFRACFVKLFNEEEDLTTRVKNFMADTLTVYRKIGGQLNHHQDERTIAAYLTYRFPDRYTFFKDTFYKKYCKMAGIEPKPKGEKYAHYMELVYDFRDGYVVIDKDLISLVKGFMNPDCFPDENNLVLVQDIFYQMLDKGKEEPSEEGEEDADIDYDVVKIPLNTILYGPPGTGKTYHSINYAVSIVENKPVDEICKEERSSIKKRFEKYIEEGQIAFSTFHQSLGYEDFIEGIKPVEPESEDEQLSYAVEDGIFKQMCVNASFSFVQKDITQETESALDFSSAYDDYIDSVSEQILKGEEVKLQTISGGLVLVDSITQKNNIKIKHVNGTRYYTVSKNRLGKLAKAFPDLNQLTNINDQFRSEIGGSNSSAYWAVLNAVNQRSAQYINKTQARIKPDKEYSYNDKKRIIETLKNDDFKKENPKQYVLVIDEINRGNVSQVFGEIITLMEDDKRLGAEEALKAILPYSKENFGVPCNLHIIGTMNTADRSVEALDTALRRRFAFINLQPEPDKLTITDDGINLAEMLSVINNRLSILKDADHTIGHAWLWNVKNIEQLKGVFRVNILPLLKEYFYNDYEKLGLVLGDSFFEPHVQVNGNVFADFSGGNGLAMQYDQSWQFQLKPAEELTISDFNTLTPLTNRTLPDEEQ
jgi:5-methylcytosine-specific restriction protein B